MVTSRYQFMNLKFVYLSKKHANRTPTFGNSSGIQKRLQKRFRYDLDFSCWTSHGKNICFTEIFCNHPEKGGKMSQKQSTSACTRINIHSEIGKENKARILKSYNLLIFTIKPPPKRWNDDENETLHWIMRWGWMRWKRNLALNNEMRMNEMKMKPCI